MALNISFGTKTNLNAIAGFCLQVGFDRDTGIWNGESHRFKAWVYLSQDCGEKMGDWPELEDEQTLLIKDDGYKISLPMIKYMERQLACDDKKCRMVLGFEYHNYDYLKAEVDTKRERKITGPVRSGATLKTVGDEQPLLGQSSRQVAHGKTTFRVLTESAEKDAGWLSQIIAQAKIQKEKGSKDVKLDFSVNSAQLTDKVPFDFVEFELRYGYAVALSLPELGDYLNGPVLRAPAFLATAKWKNDQSDNGQNFGSWAEQVFESHGKDADSAYMEVLTWQAANNDAARKLDFRPKN